MKLDNKVLTKYSVYLFSFGILSILISSIIQIVLIFWNWNIISFNNDVGNILLTFCIFMIILGIQILIVSFIALIKVNIMKIMYMTISAISLFFGILFNIYFLIRASELGCFAPGYALFGTPFLIFVWILIMVQRSKQQKHLKAIK